MIEIIFIALALVLAKTLGGLFVMRHKDKMHLILGFSAGAVLGVALFDLLPEALEMTNKLVDPIVTMALVAVGFCVYMVIDRLFSMHGHSTDCHNSRHNGKISAAALIIHGFMDGLSIGLAFKISPNIGMVVSLAILIHTFSDGINTVGVIIRDKGDRKEALTWLGVSVIVPIIGIFFGCVASVPEVALGLLLALFSGFFLYISASDLIPESHHAHPTIWTTLSTAIGLVVIFVAVTFSGI